MGKEKLLQVRIWGWQASNSKWIYVILATFFLVLVPVIGILFRMGRLPDEYNLVYGYTMFAARTFASALGCIPLLLAIYAPYHLAVGECLMLCPKWDEKKQCLISYAFFAVIICIMMTCLTWIYRRGIPVVTFGRDLVSLLVVVWLLSSAAHLLTVVSHNVFFALIFIELYGILFWNLGVGSEQIWNAFSVVGAEGILWWIRVVLYGALGVMLTEISDVAGRKG